MHFSSRSLNVADGRKASLTNSGFGTVFGVADGKPLPVVDYAGFAPFGFGYRRCPGEQLTEQVFEDSPACCFWPGSPAQRRAQALRLEHHPPKGKAGSRRSLRNRARHVGVLDLLCRAGLHYSQISSMPAMGVVEVLGQGVGARDLARQSIGELSGGGLQRCSRARRCSAGRVSSCSTSR